MCTREEDEEKVYEPARTHVSICCKWIGLDAVAYLSYAVTRVIIAIISATTTASSRSSTSLRKSLAVGSFRELAARLNNRATRCGSLHDVQILSRRGHDQHPS
jgi:hypothetical protein